MTDVNNAPIHSHFFNDRGVNNRLHSIIVFSSLNSSGLKPEEFNDENTMMECNLLLTPPSLRK